GFSGNMRAMGVTASESSSLPRAYFIWATRLRMSRTGCAGIISSGFRGRFGLFRDADDTEKISFIAATGNARCKAGGAIERLEVRWSRKVGQAVSPVGEAVWTRRNRLSHLPAPQVFRAIHDETNRHHRRVDHALLPDGLRRHRAKGEQRTQLASGAFRSANQVRQNVLVGQGL